MEHPRLSLIVSLVAHPWVTWPSFLRWWTVFQWYKMTSTCFTRMHFSRMRTGRSLTVCCSLLLGGGGREGGAWRGPPFPPWVWAWIWSPSISPLGVGLDLIPLNFTLRCVCLDLIPLNFPLVSLDLIPLNFPLGCGPGFPSWVWAWIWSPSISPLGVGLDLPLNFPLGCGPGPDPLNFPLGCWPRGGVLSWPFAVVLFMPFCYGLLVWWPSD